MVIAWIGYCLLVSALLGLAAFAAERALGHLGKPVRWAWFAAIAGSVAAPLVALFAPGLLPSAVASTAPPLTGLGELAAAVSSPVGTDTVAPPGSIDLAVVSVVLGWGWTLLVAAMTFHLARVYRCLRSEMRTWTPGRVLGSPVMISEERGPAVVGIGRSVVVMPKWIPDLEDRLLRLVFLHEREHQRAGDHRLFTVALAALVLMPWNACLWWQASRLRLAIEFDCDRRVLARGASPRDYADALIAVGSRVSSPLLGAAAFAQRKSAVERRLRRMTEPLARLRVTRTLGASAVTVLAIIVVLGCPAPEASLNAPEPPAAALSLPSEAIEWEPPPTPGAAAIAQADGPVFIPFDTYPVLENGAEVQRALIEAYPVGLKFRIIGGRVEFRVRVDETGVVQSRVVKISSDNEELDGAAMEVVDAMRFQPAMNRDEPTAVWVSQWITFEGAPGGFEGAPAGAAPDPRPLIVVDGVIRSDGVSLPDIRILDIGHVEIIKGEQAVTRYGERARHGVVQITTKAP